MVRIIGKFYLKGREFYPASSSNSSISFAIDTSQIFFEENIAQG